MVYLGLWSTEKACLKRTVLGWVLNLAEWVDFTDWQIDGVMKPNDLRLHFGIFKSFSLENRKMHDVWYLQCKTKRGCWSMQKFLSCIHCWILEEASAVYLTVVLFVLAYVSSEQAMLHCSGSSMSHCSVRPTSLSNAKTKFNCNK